MRSQGQVRFITITSRMQIAAASLVVAVIGGWGLSMGVMAVSQYRAEADRAVAARARSRSRHGRKPRRRLSRRHRRGRRRPRAPAGIPRGSDRDAARRRASPARPSPTAASEAAKTVAKVSAVDARGRRRSPGSRRASSPSSRRLTRYADRRAARAEAAIRKLGLDPAHDARRGPRRAQGGPFEQLSTARDGSLDPRFERLGAQPRADGRARARPQRHPAGHAGRHAHDLLGLRLSQRSVHRRRRDARRARFPRPDRRADPCRGQGQGYFRRAPSPVTAKSSKSATATA